MLAINDLTYAIGSRILYEDASLFVGDHDKIGLIGPNGSGKSTLFKIITGQATPEKGGINTAKETTIGFLNQDLLSYETDASIRAVTLQAFERACEVQKAIDQVLQEMEKDYQEEQTYRLAELQEEFEQLGGYEMEAQTEKVLEGMGFSTSDLDRPLSSFSGGWRMRVMLGKLLLQAPSLLLLDEPTNHLDLPSIQWLEGYLRNYPHAVMVISHDRDFLDNVTNKTVAVDRKQLIPYAGNYSFYETERVVQLEIQRGAYANQQQQIKQTEQFIQRFRAKASKAKQAQSRMKALEKLDRIEAPQETRVKLRISFPIGQPSGREVITVKEVDKSYGDLTILKRARGEILRGEKIALIGANGKGKSTLLRLLAQTEMPNGGNIQRGHNVQVSFYAQHQLESLCLENTVLQELEAHAKNKPTSDVRKILGMFLFSGDDVDKPIKVLSGGERARVALAKVLCEEANFLLLDEPTNHLDLQSIEVLTQALQQYEGTLLVVSHNRHFISQLANKIWYIDNHALKEYPGTYAEYQHAQAAKEH